jgi:hypothetical protein
MIYRIEAFIEFSDATMDDHSEVKRRLESVALGVRQAVGSNGLYRGEISIAPHGSATPPPTYRKDLSRVGH